MSRGLQVMRVTGQLTDGSRGSRVKKCDPLSSLVRVRVNPTTSRAQRRYNTCKWTFHVENIVELMTFLDFPR